MHAGTRVPPCWALLLGFLCLPVQPPFAHNFWFRVLPCSTPSHAQCLTTWKMVSKILSRTSFPGWTPLLASRSSWMSECVVLQQEVCFEIRSLYCVLYLCTLMLSSWPSTFYTCVCTLVDLRWRFFSSATKKRLLQAVKDGMHRYDERPCRLCSNQSNSNPSNCWKPHQGSWNIFPQNHLVG